MRCSAASLTETAGHFIPLWFAGMHNAHKSSRQNVYAHVPLLSSTPATLARRNIDQSCEKIILEVFVMSIVLCIPIVFLVVSVALSIRAVKRGKDQPGCCNPVNRFPSCMCRYLCSANDRICCF